MEDRGRDLARRFPDQSKALWAVVDALCRQARHRDAWGYMVEHDLSPADEQDALLAISVYVDMDAPAGDADRLLCIAGMFPDSEQVAGNAIAALMIGKGGRAQLSDDQKSKFSELVEGFERRYPDSAVLSAHSVPTPEDFWDTVREQTERQALNSATVIAHVRHGSMPYGALLAVKNLPYAEHLLLVAAGFLTAISADAATRERERAAVRAARGGVVAADTSVAVMGLLADLDQTGMGAAFSRVLVADELLVDAKQAVASAGHTGRRVRRV